MPGITLKLSSVVLGIMLILEGVEKAKKTKTSGVFYIIFGIIFILNTKIIGNMLSNLLGIILLLKGVENYNNAKQMKNLNIRGYVLQYALAVITVIFGVVRLVIPFSAAKIITSLIALCFIYLGITQYAIYSSVKKLNAEITDADDTYTPLD